MRPFQKTARHHKVKNTKDLIRKIRTGRISESCALKEIKALSYLDLGFAKIDRHRRLRRGFPEVVFGEGKTNDQILKICLHMDNDNVPLLVTRTNESVYKLLRSRIKGLKFDPMAGAVYRMSKSKMPKKNGFIAIVTAGTSDLRIAREAMVTCNVMGSRTRLFCDVGVAGVHRLIENAKTLQKADVIIVAAGMEGALASVVGGMVSRPVVAVPTSVGYGASFRGIAPLLTMLNSCAPGVAVVNIDNGFGAGYLASMINR